MILLDTHAWIWLSSDAEKLSTRAAKAIAGAKRLGLSAISCREFAMLIEKEG